MDGKLTEVVEEQAEYFLENERLSTTIKKENVVIAKWLPFGHSNRVTPPDLIKGETVLLFTYGDTGEYYWTTIFNEPIIRRRERVVYLYGNMDEDTKYKEVLGENNSHWIDINAYDKYIRLHTSDNAGEATAYDIILDLKEGVLTIRDAQENSIVLDSVNGVLTAQINEKIHAITKEVVVDCDNATVNASEDIKALAKGNVVVDAGKNISATAGSNISANASGNISASAGGNVSVQASAVSIQAPNIALQGNVTISGSLAVAGGMAVGGGSPSSGQLSINGNLVGTGSININGDLTANTLTALVSCSCPNYP